MNTEARIRAIKVLIEKGDKATEKAEQYYVAAGQHLKTLKDRSASAAAWERIVKQKCNLGKSRAYELLKIADGRTLGRPLFERLRQNLVRCGSVKVHDDTGLSNSRRPACRRASEDARIKFPSR